MLSEASYKTNDTLTDDTVSLQKDTLHCILFLIVSKNHVGSSKPQQQPRRRRTYHISMMLIGLYRDHTVAERQRQKSRKPCDSVGIVSQPFRLFPHLFKFTSDSFKELWCASSWEQMTSLSLLSGAFPTLTQAHTNTLTDVFISEFFFSFCPRRNVDYIFFSYSRRCIVMF